MPTGPFFERGPVFLILFFTGKACGGGGGEALPLFGGLLSSEGSDEVYGGGESLFKSTVHSGHGDEEVGRSGKVEVFDPDAGGSGFFRESGPLVVKNIAFRRHQKEWRQLAGIAVQR